MTEFEMSQVWDGEVLRVQEEVAKNHREAAEASRFVLPTPVDVMSFFTTLPPVPDLVLPGLRVGSVGSIVSPGGTGKSMLALQLSLFVAAGIDERLGIGAAIVNGGGQVSTSGTLPMGRVVYLSAEDGADVLHERLHALGTRLNTSQREAVAQNFTLLDMTTKAGDLFDSTFRDAVEEAITDARLLFIDTLRTFHTQDESDNGQMSLLITWLRRMAATKRCAIVFLHHTSKAAALNGQGDLQQASRGASALTDNIRWQAFLAGLAKDEPLKIDGTTTAVVDDKERKKYVRLGISKQNYGMPMSDLWLTRSDGGVMERVGAGGVPMIPHTAAQQQARNDAYGGRGARDDYPF